MGCLSNVESSKKTDAALDLIPEDHVWEYRKFERGVDMKFDFVVGNPPWGLNENDNRSTNGTKLYEKITAVAINCAKDDGIISFVIPSKFATTKNSKFAKKVMTVGVKEIHYFGKTKIDVDKSCLNIILDKKIGNTETFIVIDERGRASTKHDIFMCVAEHQIPVFGGENFGDIWGRGKINRSNLIRPSESDDFVEVVETVNGKTGPLLTSYVKSETETTGLG